MLCLVLLYRTWYWLASSACKSLAKQATIFLESLDKMGDFVLLVISLGLVFFFVLFFCSVFIHDVMGKSEWVRISGNCFYPAICLSHFRWAGLIPFH